tara:strand:- start:10 stop:552 length:543 start_codon:yes stop_codon:yes gene_type:complete
MGLQPTLDNLRIVQHRVFIDDSNPPKKRLNYVKQSKGHLGLVHTKLWESIKHNNRHTLRLDRKVVDAILSKTGPHGRRDKSRGRPASGIRHLLRREIMLLFNMEYSKLRKILLQNIDYKSGKKLDITLVMPDLSLAINELKQELISIEPGLVNHLVFKRMWAPCLSRLVELVWLHKTNRS